MKKLLALLALFVCCSSPVLAQTRALSTRDLGPIYLGAHHLDGTINKLVFTRSRDGISFERIGATVPFTPAVGGLRDPSIFYYAPTKEFIIAYTKATTPTTFDTEIGLCKTKDFITVEALTDITVGGISPAFTWSGSFFVDDGNYYLLFLPLGTAGNKNTHGAGWIRCTNPGTWTTWTNFVSLKATNAAWSAATDLNDPHITKIGSTYHLFIDGDNGTDDPGLLHATSSSPLTGYSALAAVTNHDAREGAILTTTPAGAYRLYSQVVFGALSYADSADLSAWGSPAEVNWPGKLIIGNGEVIRVDSLDAQAAILAAPNNIVEVADSAGYGNTAIRFPGNSLSLLLNGTLTGNADTTDDRSWLSVSTTSNSAADKLSTLEGQLTATGPVRATAHLTGTASRGYQLDLVSTGNLFANIERGTTSDNALFVISPAGALNSSNPQWNWGTIGNTSNFSFNRYDGSTYSDFVITTAGDINFQTGHVSITTAGKGLRIKEGSNARMGTATLASGTVTVSNTSVSASTRIFLSRKSPGSSTALGVISGGTVTASTSFVINALKTSDATVETADVSVVDWLLVEPAP